MKKILFLADRNILVDQAIRNDFKPFGQVMHKIKGRTKETAYEIYLALYQSISGTDERANLYKTYEQDFFDLIIIDECHRGSAKEDSVWRDILRHFNSAVHLGLTATPKETKYVSNIGYFGEPVYTYSLKQGIDDGFLAPYKVIRSLFDVDFDGYHVNKGDTDKYGTIIPEGEYGVRRDFDRTLVLEDRTILVAKELTEYLQNTDRYSKTIVFCENIEHAERMRKELINLNQDLVSKNRKYIMRITGDSDEGVAELDNFIDPSSTYPVIATTSKLLTTGVDAQTCKIIVLDSNIRSMTQFKQIIGRGTRINEDYGKSWFTIMDFRNVTKLFYDPEFDGEPESIFEGPPPKRSEPTPGTDGDKRKKYFVKGIEVEVLNQRIQYLDKDGNLITESIQDYSKKRILAKYRSMDEFIKEWGEAEKKRVLVQELISEGVFIDELQKEIGLEIGVYDLICHIAYDKTPLTRNERVRKVKENNYFTEYGERARLIIDALLDKYADQGIFEIEEVSTLKIRPFSDIGTMVEIVNEFGGKQKYISFNMEICIKEVIHITIVF